MNFELIWEDAENLAGVGIDYYEVDPAGAKAWLGELDARDLRLLAVQLLEEVESLKDQLEVE